MAKTASTTGNQVPSKSLAPLRRLAAPDRRRKWLCDQSPLVAQRVAWSSVNLVQLLRSYQNNPDDPSPQGHMAIRDVAMADNITTLVLDVNVP